MIQARISWYGDLTNGAAQYRWTVLQWRDYLIGVRGDDERHAPTTRIEWHTPLPNGAEDLGVFYYCRLSLDTLCRVAAEMVSDGWIIRALDPDLYFPERYRGRDQYPRLIAMRPRPGDDIGSPEWREYWRDSLSGTLSRDMAIPLFIARATTPEAV